MEGTQQFGESRKFANTAKNTYVFEQIIQKTTELT